MAVCGRWDGRSTCEPRGARRIGRVAACGKSGSASDGRPAARCGRATWPLRVTRNGGVNGAAGRDATRRSAAAPRLALGAGPRTARLGISRAPKLARCSVFIWQSITPNPHAPELPHKVHERDLGGVRARARTSTPRRTRDRLPRRRALRPARRPSTSRSSARSRRVQPLVRGDHPTGDPRPRLGVTRRAHARMTSPKAVSAVTRWSSLFMRLASDFATCSSWGKSTIRGSGLHHRIGSPSPNHGKIPCAYASTSVPTDRLRPTASSPLGRRSARSSGGKGSRGPRAGIDAERCDVGCSGCRMSDAGCHAGCACRMHGCRMSDGQATRARRRATSGVGFARDDRRLEAMPLDSVASRQTREATGRTVA